MRSTLRKILASALIAAMIACVGAGCAKKDDTSKQSSAASTASQTSGESKTEESKTEESKTEESSGDNAEAYAAIIGTYALTAEDGTVAAALQLNADSSAVLQNVTGETKQGTWAVTEGKIVVTTDETVSFNYVDGNLVSTEQPDYVFVKQNAETPEQPAENDESGEEPDEGGEDAGDEGGDEE